jgi:hypothetical protein
MFSWHATEKKDAPSERRIVVFDPLERKLWVDTKENLQGTSILTLASPCSSRT